MCCHIECATLLNFNLTKIEICLSNRFYLNMYEHLKSVRQTSCTAIIPGCIMEFKAIPLIDGIHTDVISCMLLFFGLKRPFEIPFCNITMFEHVYMH